MTANDPEGVALIGRTVDQLACVVLQPVVTHASEMRPPVVTAVRFGPLAGQMPS